MTHTPSGHIEQLPSGSWRAKVYAGTDPLTGREIRFRKTRKTEVEAQIELGKLLELARAGRQPDTDVTVAELLDQYVPVAGWDLSTEETNLGYIRRTIKPTLGTKEVRKVRGPLLDNLYTRLQKCGNLACAGKPFTEHRHVPDLRPDPSDPRAKWQQAADNLREAITNGALVAGDDLPSVSELARLQALRPGTIQHAFLVLEEEGLLVIRHGRTAQIAGDPARGQSYRRAGQVGEAATRPRLRTVRLPAARLPSDEAQHHPRHPQHPVRCVRSRSAVGMGRLQPGRVRETAHRYEEEDARHPAGRGCEGDRAGPPLRPC
jgi:DNA-binding transcriptional regulator YhcF (GntR family)